jgi:hypothetical protein
MIRNRARLTAVVAAAVLVVGVPLWLAAVSQAHAPHHGRSHRAARRHRGRRRHRLGVRAANPQQVAAPAFDIHLTPTFEVGQAGWNVVMEQNGAFDGSTGIGVIHPSTPFVSIYGSSQSGSHESTTVAVTLPEVSAVLLEGNVRVPTEVLPSLPYGLRAVRVTSPYEEPRSLPGSLAGAPPIIKPLVALGSDGAPIPQPSTRETRETPFQGKVHKWSYPSGPAQGSCELHTASIPGLIAQSGATLSDIAPYPGQIFAHAFLPCAATLYSLHGHELRAYVLLDAANPGAPPAVIPGIAPVAGAPGIYGGNGGFYGGPTDLTAKRSGDAWLAVQGGSDSERMQLLEDLSATIQL